MTSDIEDQTPRMFSRREDDLTGQYFGGDLVG